MFKKLNTYYQLGILNLLRVLFYRLFLKVGIYRLLYPIEEATTNLLFQSINLKKKRSKNLSYDVNIADNIIKGTLRFFSSKSFGVGSPPDWFNNPYNSKHFPQIKYHWSNIDEHNSSIGDIKAIWELSRFDWLVHLARAYVVTKNKKYLDTLNTWIEDWNLNNPPNRGPNWVCGQETSIRILNVLLAAHITGDFEQPNKALIRFVQDHCKRIMITSQYAMAQNNNHGTSESTAMFVCGAWLLEVGGLKSRELKQALKWKKKGRKWLEERVLSLIEIDGSFSQYSLNYHRVLLDTLILSEFFMVKLKLERMSDGYYRRITAAINWLCHFVDPISGNGPNLGGNDGARLINCSNDDYTNYRSTIELAALYFLGKNIYYTTDWDDEIFWLDFKKRKLPNQTFATKHFKDGGYNFIGPFPGGNKNISWGIMRIPNFKFRPAQSDIFHLDIWSEGKNILRDGGSYSYNTSAKWAEYFAGTQSHNTVQFDDRDQMPRISKFLFGSWIKLNQIEPLVIKNDIVTYSGEYIDHKGCYHRRTIQCTKDYFRVIDHFNGHANKAILRWRLIPGDWELSGNIIKSEFGKLTIESNNTVKKIELNSGFESHYYMNKTEIPVLEVEFAPGEIQVQTLIELN